MPSADQSEALPQPNPLIPNGAWKADLGTHPCLLGPARHLKALAQRWPAEYQEIRGLPEKDWDNGVYHLHAWRGQLPAAGVVRAVEGCADAPRAKWFIDQVMAYVQAGPSNVHQESWLHLQQAVMTYDLFFDQVDPHDGRQMINWVNAHLGTFVDDENAFHNSTLSKINCYLEIAYGTWHENPRAKEFRDYAIQYLYEGRIVPVLRELGQGGGYTECGWYCRHSVLHLARALELARRFEGYDGYQLAPDFFYQRLAYELLQPYPGVWRAPGLRGAPDAPGERYACEGDGNTTNDEFMEFPRQLRNILAQYFRGSPLARLAAGRDRRGTSAFIRLYDFLYREPPQNPLPITTFPPANCAVGIGKVYARSHWGDDASWLRFECGDYYNQHQHYEAGNFEIFRGEPLATESGEYRDWDGPHALNWLIRTIAHNCILIHQEGEVFEHRQRNRQHLTLANDGGQGADSFICQTLDQWKQQCAHGHRRGKIVAFQNRPELMYVAGDATVAYGPKAKLVLRQIVFLRPHTFVIFDRVVAAKPQFAKTWLLHSVTEPSIEGSTFRIVHGQGHLQVQTLLPEPCRIEKIHGYTYNGQTYEPPFSHPQELRSLWRTEVRPAEARADDTFLHVLCTEDSPRPARLLREGTQIGAAGDGEAGPWQVLFNESGGGRARVGQTLIDLETRVEA
jgi:hypothetical protein